MKNLFRAIIILAMGLLLIACGQSVTATPSPTTTITATFTPIPSQTTTATIEATHKPEYVRPTLIPTIDLMLLPELLNNAFSIQTLDLNGHKARRITGWKLGFGTMAPPYYHCPSYVWLDTSHILLYPKAGQREGYIDGDSRPIYVVPQPVVINLDSGAVWSLPVNLSSGSICNRVYWSPELEILIVPGTYEGEPAIFPYSFDGTKLATYPGELTDISPSYTKIFIDNNIIVDLRTNKKITLNWNLADDEGPFWEFYWTSDETRIYRCCYYYADLTKGISHRFTTFDYLDRQGNQAEYEGLTLYRGQWVLGDKYVLVWWQPVDDGDIKYLPMFDPATKILYDVREMAGIPDEFTSLYTPVSPNGNYVWMEGWNESYLANLTTFESQHYTYSNPWSYTDIDWSPDSKFAWFQIYDSDAESAEVNMLSASDMELHPLPIAPPNEAEHLWHPNDNLVVYPARDKNALIFWNAETMSFRELPFKDQNSKYKITNLAWNPPGDRLVFITENHILWQVDYPDLENLEQIIASTNTISGAQWSPDGNSIAFISGSDIYVVETKNK